MSRPLLNVENLSVTYRTTKGPIEAVRGVSFELGREKLGIVGESGSGKSQTGRAILRLTAANGSVAADRFDFDGIDLLAASEREMRRIRGNRISMILQDPKYSLNPVMKAGDQIAEAYRVHHRTGRRAARERAIEMLSSVLIREPERVYHSYPHELSGGMGQRVMIAMMMIPEPDIIIADEPTSALDVVVQRQVMTTLGRLQKETGASVILVGHDMGLIAQFADTVGVMYAGKLVDVAPIKQMVEEPLHPYSQLLLQSVPGLEEKQERLVGIPGMPPTLINLPPGCLFQPRCPQAIPTCSQVTPVLQSPAGNTGAGERQVACHLYD
ncbi:MAG: ABC transporter ATP-binding protein [Geminicoccaceae bacterium]|nr:ABC transporter ATP-binding protein [Geminicoccaceae bacterium]